MPGMWQTAQGYQPVGGETPWGDLASAAGGYFGKQQNQKQSQDWMESMYGKMGLFGTQGPAKQGSITYGGGGGGYTAEDWYKTPEWAT